MAENENEHSKVSKRRFSWIYFPRIFPWAHISFIMCMYLFIIRHTMSQGAYVNENIGGKSTILRLIVWCAISVISCHWSNAMCVIHRSDLSLDADGRIVQHTDTILNGYDIPARPNLFAGSASFWDSIWVLICRTPRNQSGRHFLRKLIFRYGIGGFSNVS